MDDHERLRRDRGAGLGVGEHLLQARVGEIERVRGEQADHEQVEGAGDVELLLAEQPAAGERALDVRRRLAADSLARARSKARLASTRRSPGVAPSRSA